jgi:hypothetical protein
MRRRGRGAMPQIVMATCRMYGKLSGKLLNYFSTSELLLLLLSCCLACSQVLFILAVLSGIVRAVHIA